MIKKTAARKNRRNSTIARILAVVRNNANPKHRKFPFISGRVCLQQTHLNRNTKNHYSHNIGVKNERPIRNLFGYYPMIKAIINNLKTGNQGPIAKNGLPLFQKVQNKYLKRKWRIRQDYAAGLYNREELRFVLKEAQCVLMCNFSEAIEIALKRVEQLQHNTEKV